MDLKTLYMRHQARHRTRAVISAIFIVTAAIYFSWRIQSLNPEYPIYSGIFLAAELTSLVAALSAIFLQWKVKIREPAFAPKGLSVDVLVPTCNESVALVRRTLTAAMHIDYPHETWLLDDGNRPDMRALATELRCHYLARAVNTGAKPGNLNNALRHSKADFIAVIDCDHIAQRDYLGRLLGYFSDPEVAFVQAPQDYYNTNAFQYRSDPDRGLLWHDQSSFFHIGQAGRDYWNATTCCGTSTIVRRSVIDEIGGFPEATVTEDMHLAILAQRRGYKSVYYPLPLAYGVAPVDIGEYQRQRLRWGQGNVQSSREEGLPFTSGLSLAQKICYSDLAFLYVEGWSRLVFYMAPPLAMLLGVTPIGSTPDLPYYFAPYAIAGYFCFEELGRGNMRFHTNEQLAMARWPVFLLATFAYFRKRIKWRVSSKEFIGHLQIYMLLPQFAVVSLNLAALLVAVLAPPAVLLGAYSNLTIALTALWAAANVVVGVLVIRDASRCAKNKRADYRFVLPLPADIRLAGGVTKRATVDRISASGMSVHVPGRLTLALEQPVSGVLYIPAHQMPIDMRVESGSEPTFNPRTGVTTVDFVFDWKDARLRDQLDMTLHACGWHRRLAWGGAFFHTPLEWIEHWLGVTRLRTDKIINHRLMLYRARGAGESQLRLGTLLPGATPETATVVAFEPLGEGSEIDVVWLHGVPANTRLRMGTESWEPEVASAGPDLVMAHTRMARSVAVSGDQAGDLARDMAREMAGDLTGLSLAGE